MNLIFDWWKFLNGLNIFIIIIEHLLQVGVRFVYCSSSYYYDILSYIYSFAYLLNYLLEVSIFIFYFFFGVN